MVSTNQKSYHWIVPLIVGILFIALGIMMIVLKGDSLKILIYIAGVISIVGGAIYAIIGIKNKEAPTIIIAAIMIILGVVFVTLPAFVGIAWYILLSVLLIIGGIAIAVAGFFDAQRNKLLIIISIIVAALLIAAGVALLVTGNKEGALNIVMIVIGVLTIIAGVGQLANAFAMKKANM